MAPCPSPDRALNPTAAQAAAPLAAPTATKLDAFLNAASTGPLLWAGWVDGRLEVCSGAAPGSGASSEVGRLFVEALREHFGDAASAIAEREWGLSQQPRRQLPALTVRQVVASAESAFSFLMAQSSLLQIEFSAVMLGWRFRAVAELLGLEVSGLSIERRRVLDEALGPDFTAPVPADAEALSRRLRELLVQGMH